MDESRDSHGCGKSYCCCGNLNGSNPECERCSLLRQVADLTRLIRCMREAIEGIVVPEGIDSGVILLSSDSPTHKERHTIDGVVQRVVEVYDHEHFTPLGDALVALWKMTEVFSLDG